MGPSESALSVVASFQPGGLDDKIDAWQKSVAKVDALLDDLHTTRTRVESHWTDGQDVTAAGEAFRAKRQHLVDYRDRMKDAVSALQEAKSGLAAAKHRYETLPVVGPAPTDPGSADAGASDAEREAHGDKVDAYRADKAAHDGQIREREQQAAEAVKDLDLRMKASQALLTKAAPPVPSAEPSGAEDGGSGAGSGSASGPVVGGSTSTAYLIGKGRNPSRDPAIPGIDTTSGQQDDGSTEVAAGGSGGVPVGAAASGAGGGLGSVAAGAGAMAVGRNLLGRLAGGSTPGAAASGRTAGMQKGSTLGRTAGSQTTARTSGSQTTGRTSGSQAAGRTSGSQASGRGAGSQNGARGTQNGGRGTQAGGRGTGSQAGGRGAGSAGRGGSARDKRDEKDPSIDHLAFEDDQWIDDADTSPGVIA